MLLFVLLDGFRLDYLFRNDKLLELRKLQNNGASGYAIPPLGFEPDGAYLAGLCPDEANTGALYMYDPENSPFKFLDYLPKRLLAGKTTDTKLFRKFIRYIAQKKTDVERWRKYASPIEIPLMKLSKFSLSFKKFQFEQGFLPNKTIFEFVASDLNEKFFYHGTPLFPVKLPYVEQRFLKEYIGEKYVFLHIGDLDGIGHRYGPDSEQIDEKMMEIDVFFSKALKKIKKFHRKINIVILGDHGMVNVRRTIDTQFIAKKLDNENILYFIDSTMFRIWADKKKLSRIEEIFGQNKGYFFLTNDLAKKYHVKYNHNKYWDYCYVCRPGYVFSPNFYSKINVPIGMHGYYPECNENKAGFLISYDKMHLKDNSRVCEIEMKNFYRIQINILKNKEIVI